MSDKERLEDAKKWIGQMRLILSSKTDKDEIAYVQSKIDLFEWLIEQAEQLERQNKRYREVVEYVITAKPTHYKNLENALVDITHVIMEMLEEESE